MKVIVAALICALCASCGIYSVYKESKEHPKFCERNGDCESGKHCVLYGRPEGACTADASPTK